MFIVSLGLVFEVGFWGIVFVLDGEGIEKVVLFGL